MRVFVCEQEAVGGSRHPNVKLEAINYIFLWFVHPIHSCPCRRSHSLFPYYMAIQCIQSEAKHTTFLAPVLPRIICEFLLPFVEHETAVCFYCFSSPGPYKYNHAFRAFMNTRGCVFPLELPGLHAPLYSRSFFQDASLPWNYLTYMRHSIPYHFS